MASMLPFTRASAQLHKDLPKVLTSNAVVGERERPRSQWQGSGDSWSRAARNNILLYENDIGSSDRSYTNGISYQTERLYVPRWLEHRLHQKAISTCGLLSMQPCAFTSLGLSQTMFTPESLSVVVLQPRSRPYAGLLLATAGLRIMWPSSLISFNLDGGVGGPPALARETQSLAHWAWSTGAVRPRGWDNQLRFTPHLQTNTQLTHTLLSSHDWSAADGGRAPSFSTDLRVSGEASMGTINGRASLGGAVRVGYRMPAWGGSMRIMPTGRGATRSATVRAIRSFFEELNRDAWIFAFGSATGRAIGWNHTLEGVPLIDGGPKGWREQGSIRIERGVTELSYGVSAGTNTFGLAFQRIVRSKEFDTGAEHRFINLGVYLFGTQVARGR
jgi:hypothetical protein